MWSEHHLFIPNQCFMNCLRCPWVVAPVSHATTVTGWCATPAQRMASFRGILQKGQQEMKANLCPNDGNTICFWSKKHSLRRKWWLKSWIHHSERDAIFHFHSSPEFVRGPNYGASVWDLQKKRCDCGWDQTLKRSSAMDSEFGVSSKVTRELLPTIAGPFLSPRSVGRAWILVGFGKGRNPTNVSPGVNQRGKFWGYEDPGRFFSKYMRSHPWL